MGARRIRTTLNEEWRKKISLTKIAQRLDDCFFGDVVLRPDQLKALEIMLDRTVPRLTRTEIVNDGESTFQSQVNDQMTRMMLSLMTKEQLMALRLAWEEQNALLQPPPDNATIEHEHTESTQPDDRAD